MSINEKTYNLPESKVANRGRIKGALDLAKKVLSEMQFEVFESMFLVSPDHRKDIRRLAIDFKTSEDEIKTIVSEAVKHFAEQAEIAGKSSYLTREMIKYCPGVEHLWVPYATAKKSLGKAPSVVEKIIPRQVEKRVDEEKIYEQIRFHGFDNHILKQLGEIHAERDDFERALYFYGAALDLDQTDEEAKSNLSKMETKLGYVYVTGMHFSRLEQYIQDRVNPAAPDLSFDNASAEHPQAYTNGHYTKRPMNEGLYSKAASPVPPQANGSPSVTLALPPFIIGQKVTVIFNMAAPGQLTVTMEVTPSENVGSAKTNEDVGLTGDSQHTTDDGAMVSITTSPLALQHQGRKPSVSG